ncbi:hypothetical protein [Francisella tularensis]|nr:hypothetical protein [Francisella tularensis]
MMAFLLDIITFLQISFFYKYLFLQISFGLTIWLHEICLIYH